MFICVLNNKPIRQEKLLRTLKLTEPDFVGQDIYFDIDQGDKFWKTGIMTSELEHAPFTQLPKIEVFVDYMHRNFPGATVHCVYETGYYGFWAYEQIRFSGFDCLVVNTTGVSKNIEKDCLRQIASTYVNLPVHSAM
jgi:hypothetical protein